MKKNIFKQHGLFPYLLQLFGTKNLMFLLFVFTTFNLQATNKTNSDNQSIKTVKLYFGDNSVLPDATLAGGALFNGYSKRRDSKKSVDRIELYVRKIKHEGQYR